MKYIYYNVSGDFMELLQLFSSFISEKLGFDIFDLISKLKNGELDLPSIISQINPQKLESVFSGLSNLFKKENPVNDYGANLLEPIISFADESTVFALNGYFSQASI